MGLVQEDAPLGAVLVVSLDTDGHQPAVAVKAVLRVELGAGIHQILLRVDSYLFLKQSSNDLCKFLLQCSLGASNKTLPQKLVFTNVS
jgi:hypothetical protein